MSFESVNISITGDLNQFWWGDGAENLTAIELNKEWKGRKLSK